MVFDGFQDEAEFRRAWDAVAIERGVRFSLFTFGDSDMPYYLVTGPEDRGEQVGIRQGQVTVSRPTIITPENVQPEFRNFFDDPEDYGYVEFLMARTAAFGNLKLTKQEGRSRIVTDTVAEAVAKLSQQLDDEEEEHVAILTAPAPLAGLAVLRYASERIWSSAPDNVQELRERGFLP